MGRRLFPALLIAALMAGVCCLVLYRMLPQQASSAVSERKVVVAVRQMPVGTLVREMDLALAPWSGDVPAGLAQKREDLVGRGVTATIYPGEPVHQSRLAPRGAGGGLAAIIPPGMRAVAVRVNDVVGVAGFVLPGMRVDVLISGNPTQGNRGTLSRTLLQNIEVLSAGQNIQKDAEGKPVAAQVVNLLVTPEQAEKLTLAGTDTRIQLVLRNPLDTQLARTPGTALQSLFEDVAARRVVYRPPAAPVRRETEIASAPPPPQPPPQAPAAPWVVELINGSKRSEMRFAAPATP